MNLYVVLSIVLPIISPIIYVRSILQGISRPQRMTRLVTLLITVLTFASVVAQGNKAAVGLAVISMLQAIVIFGFSLRFGMGGRNRLDFICLAIALCGIILWQTTGSSLLALYASIMADFAGYIPALIKTYRFPRTEDWRFYALDCLAGCFAGLAVGNFAPAMLAYPLYIFVINAAMVSFIVTRQYGRPGMVIDNSAL